ncbi:MAG: hypothetical protein MJ099_02535 [Clostridia bacterium]|nr:hypothetical protein [Clostridia bacterium]
MYCRKCGTFIPGTGELCEKCSVEENLYPAQTTDTIQDRYAHSIDMSRAGRGVALIGLVAPIVSLIMTLIIFGALIAYAAGHYYYFRPGFGTVLLLILLFGFLGVEILSIIFAAKGIGAFRRACRMDASKKPVASLVMSIIGLNVDVVAIIYSLVAIGGIIALFSVY